MVSATIISCLDYSLLPESPSQFILYTTAKAKSNRASPLLAALLATHCKTLKRPPTAAVSSLLLHTAVTWDFTCFCTGLCASCSPAGFGIPLRVQRVRIILFCPLTIPFTSPLAFIHTLLNVVYASICLLSVSAIGISRG